MPFVHRAEKEGFDLQALIEQKVDETTASACKVPSLPYPSFAFPCLSFPSDDF
jgi:hypothetical protein